MPNAIDAIAVEPLVRCVLNQAFELLSWLWRAAHITAFASLSRLTQVHTWTLYDVERLFRMGATSRLYRWDTSCYVQLPSLYAASQQYNEASTALRTVHNRTVHS